jgi:hypothetical protein
MPNAKTVSLKPQVCRGEGQTAYKRALGYQMLGICPSEVERIPYFRSQLRKIARLARVANRRCESSVSIPALALLAISSDPEAAKVRSAYLSVPESYRRLLPPEAFCHAAGVSPWIVLEAITLACVRSGAAAAAIVAAVNGPRVVQKTIEAALTDEGSKARNAFLNAVGYHNAGLRSLDV